MRFSILHISDLHRDQLNEVSNDALLQSLTDDLERYTREDPRIVQPSICIVTGDLVYGVKRNSSDPTGELSRQYAQAEQLLIAIAERFFEGDKSRIVLLPGNHDVCFPTVAQSCKKVDIPASSDAKNELYAESTLPHPLLRWSPAEFCFYRIEDYELYNRRLGHFAEMFHRFYGGTRSFSLDPNDQHGIFDYPDLNLAVLALTTCFENDPWHRQGAISETSLAKGLRQIRDPRLAGRLTVAAWHHSLWGSPNTCDFLDADLLQILTDAGISLGLHGHQHRAQLLEEFNRLGSDHRKITIISAASLCAGPTHLYPGEPRSYNIIEIYTDGWTGRVHQRRMNNNNFAYPMWGPGHFITTMTSHQDFHLSPPKQSRPASLDANLVLELGSDLLGKKNWLAAANALLPIKDHARARRSCSKR